MAELANKRQCNDCGFELNTNTKYVRNTYWEWQSFIVLIAIQRQTSKVRNRFVSVFRIVIVNWKYKTSKVIVRHFIFSFILIWFNDRDTLCTLISAFFYGAIHCYCLILTHYFSEYKSVVQIVIRYIFCYHSHERLHVQLGKPLVFIVTT
jgi:hypothetical protein